MITGMAVYQVGRSIGTRFIRDNVPVWNADQPMSAYKGCYRTAGARPAGITLRGDSYFGKFTRNLSLLVV